jgi:hypothetical protein
MLKELELKKEMKRSYLIQRLNKPRVLKMQGVDLGDIFSFGGGLLHGGLSPSAMDMLKNIFSFDYMGSAEFEWGAVPEAFIFLAKNKLVCGSLQIDKGKTVYFICPKSYEAQVKVKIQEIYSRKTNTKEWVGLKEYFEKDQPQTCGWLEIDNGFMFFADLDMYQKTASLFGLKV